MKTDFFDELKALDTSYIVSKWMLDRIPHIFAQKNDEHIIWKEQLAKLIEVDSRSIVFTGSSCTGFSLNPTKKFRAFNKGSDIDIAVISNHHFEIAWRTLRTLGTKRYDLDSFQQASLKDHVDRLIYWGTIASDKLLPILPFGKNWVLAFESMSNLKPTIGREIKARIYKDFDSLRAYNHNNLLKIRGELLIKGK